MKMGVRQYPNGTALTAYMVSLELVLTVGPLGYFSSPIEQRTSLLKDEHSVFSYLALDKWLTISAIS